jgi:SMI1 / KNR4 family (SUKH-1)
MDWIEQLKILAHDPNRAISGYVRNNVTNPDGTRHLPTAYPPATLEEVEEFEAEAGVRLPTDLRRVYLEVGNGGFGPGYGLTPLTSPENIIKKYKEQLEESKKILGGLWTENMIKNSINRYKLMTEVLSKYLYFRDFCSKDYNRVWPDYLLPFCSGGCDLVGVVDLRNEKVGFVQYEIIDGEPLENIIEWKASSVKSWFESWIDNNDLMYYSEVFMEETLNPLFEK